MCMCPKPNVNGQPGYRWNHESQPLSTYPVNPPELGEFDELLNDLPGRCGGCDSHSYHFRVVDLRGRLWLLVRHGGGDEQHEIGSTSRGHRRGIREALERCPGDDARYWLCQTLYHLLEDTRRAARDAERTKWRQAAYDNRIKVNRRKKPATVQILEAAQ
jgi:hypothetical protein